LRNRAQIDGDLALDQGDQEIKPRTAVAFEPAEAENDGALVFLRHANRQ
jgi:hypothetical protein